MGEPTSTPKDGDEGRHRARPAVAIGIVTPASTLGLTNDTPHPTAILETGVDNLAPGMQIGQYELIRELGRGGMGVVFAARDLKLGRRVAIKFLRHATRDVANRFVVEARATARCNHENIVIIHEVNDHDGMPYMVLEYLEGQTLRAILGPWGDAAPLPPSRVIELMIPVARALGRAHQLGIVHRDLKPENVFVTTDGQVKVLDFGIAKALHGRDGGPPSVPAGRESSQDMQLTRQGALIGTLPYMAPEQIEGVNVDGRADLWAVGMMMFEMLLGRHPVEPLTADGLLGNLVREEPMATAHSMRGVPSDLAESIDACLVKDPFRRLRAAADLVHRLEPLLPGRHGRTLVEGESPYPGLTAFQESDANRFFGRARDVARAVARLREVPLLGVVGPSGVGKSSFVRAGIGPALKASGERWDVVTIRPGRAPVAALAAVIQRLSLRTTPAGAPPSAEAHDAAELLLRAEPGYLGQVLRERARDAGGHILLFVDQFEELYTLGTDAEARAAFTAALAAVADDTAAPLRVVVSMRSDLLDRAAEDPRFLDELTRGLVFLTPPDRDGLRDALVQPVEMLGYQFETAAMIEDMLDALAGTPGALPLLQFAAGKLWDARDRRQWKLTTASYEAIGGISGALAAHADDVVATMTGAAQRLTRNVFRRLVTPERTRAIVELDDLHQLAGDRGELTKVIDQLVAGRLLVVQTRGEAGGGSVEIVHESLIDRWPTLRRWLDEDQEDAAFRAQLATAAKQWEARGRPMGLLWGGDAMAEAVRWHALRRAPLPARDQAFLDAVLALERRGRRARNTALIAAFAVLAAIAGGAVVAYLRVRTAEADAQASAEKARQSADAATEALAKMQREEAARKEAEAGKTTAESAREQALAKAAEAEAAAAKSGQQVEESREELKFKAQKLEVAVDEAKKATVKAQQSAAEARQAKADLEKALAREKARVKELEEEKRKLSTKLK